MPNRGGLFLTPAATDCYGLGGSGDTRRDGFKGSRPGRPLLQGIRVFVGAVVPTAMIEVCDFAEAATFAATEIFVAVCDTAPTWSLRRFPSLTALSTEYKASKSQFFHFWNWEGFLF